MEGINPSAKEASPSAKGANPSTEATNHSTKRLSPSTEGMNPSRERRSPSEERTALSASRTNRKAAKSMPTCAPRNLVQSRNQVTYFGSTTIGTQYNANTPIASETACKTCEQMLRRTGG